MSHDSARESRPLEFDDVYRRFHDRIQRYLGRLLGASDAEDATQEVFSSVNHALPGFRGNSSLSTWIYRIATNAAYDRLRSAQTARRAREIDLGAAAMPDPSDSVERQLARKEMGDCIDGYITRLPPDYRAAVVLSQEAGLTNQEIADALNVSLDTVKIRLHRARVRLRRELGVGCDFYRDDRNELACEPKREGVSRRD